jgi:hypothetical protein
VADEPVSSEPVSGRNLPAFRKMQGDFEKMQRGVDCNRSKSGPFSMACVGLSLLEEQGESYCLAGTFREMSAESRITAKIK